MLETFKSENAAQFRQRFEGTYGFFTSPNTKKKILVLIGDIGESEVTFRDNKKVTYHARIDEGNEFEFTAPEKRLFLVNNNLCIIQRKPARQFSRGICGNNTSVTDLTLYRNLGVSFTVLEHLYRKTDNGSARVKEFTSSKDTCVLSRCFGITNGSFYVYDKVYGSVDVVEGKVSILLTEEGAIFKQEVEDTIRNLNLDWKVSVE